MAERPARLARFAGLLQIDGQAAYKRLADPERPEGAARLASCSAHLRREFYELHVGGVSETARAGRPNE